MDKLNLKTNADLDVDNPQPGIYTDVPDSKYFSIDAVNNSKLTSLLNDTPADYKLKLESGELENSPEKELGSIAHVALLQPEELEDRVKTLPTANKNSNKFYTDLAKVFPDAPTTKKLKWAENFDLIKETYPDVLVDDGSNYQKATAMVNKLKWADRNWGGWILHTVMETGYAEVVLIWEDKKHGFLCKAKLDWWNPELNLFFDYKTTKDASPWKFHYSVSDYGYHRQQVHYWNGSQALGMDIHTTMILAQQKTGAYVHHWYEFVMDPSEAMGTKARGDEWNIAHSQLDRAKNTLVYCQKNDYWPGFTILKESKPISPLALKYDDYYDRDQDPFTDGEKLDLPPGLVEDQINSKIKANTKTEKE